MKKLLLLLLFCTSVYAQTLTEKYNTYLNRYEFFNSNNQLIGYKKYNTYSRSWEYFEEKSQQVYQPQSNVNVSLTQQVLANKQTRFEHNKQRLQSTIDRLLLKTYSLLPTKSKDEIAGINLAYYDVYAKPLNEKSYDLSSDAVTNRLINYLTSSYDRMIANTD